jgi:SAM-dependent methyltransferase
MAQPHAEEIIDSARWNRVSRIGGAPHYLDDFLGELKRSVHLELIERWGGIPTAGRVLKTDLFEESIGPDAYLPVLSSNGAFAVGMDVSPAIALRARGRDVALTASYVASDSRSLPFADSTFALVVCPSTLDHFRDSRDLGRSLRELARVLTPGGRLIITLDNRQNVFDPLLRLINRMEWTPYYLGRSYTVAELRKELELAGYRVVDTTAILQNPRLMAVAAVTIARKIGWKRLTRLVQRALVAAQRLERTRVRYYFGSFVAAAATRRS